MQRARLLRRLDEIAIEALLMRGHGDRGAVLVLPALSLDLQQLVIGAIERVAGRHARERHVAFRRELLLGTLEIVAELAGARGEIALVVVGQRQMEGRAARAATGGWRAGATAHWSGRRSELLSSSSRGICSTSHAPARGPRVASSQAPTRSPASGANSRSECVAVLGPRPAAGRSPTDRPAVRAWSSSGSRPTTWPSRRRTTRNHSSWPAM